MRSYHSSSNLAAELAADQQLAGLPDSVLGSPVGAVHPLGKRDTSTSSGTAAAASEAEQQQPQQPALPRPHHVSFVDEVVGDSGSSSPRMPSSSTHVPAGYDSAPGSQRVSLDGHKGSEGGAAAAGGAALTTATGVQRGSSFSALSGAVSHMGAPPVLAGPGSGRFSAAADAGVSAQCVCVWGGAHMHSLGGPSPFVCCSCIP